MRGMVRMSLKGAVAHRRMQTLANLLNIYTGKGLQLDAADVHRWIMMTGGVSHREVWDALGTKRMRELCHLYLVKEKRKISLSEEFLIWLWQDALLHVSSEAYDQAVQALMRHLWDECGL